MARLFYVCIVLRGPFLVRLVLEMRRPGSSVCDLMAILQWLIEDRRTDCTKVYKSHGPGDEAAGSEIRRWNAKAAEFHDSSHILKSLLLLNSEYTS